MEKSRNLTPKRDTHNFIILNLAKLGLGIIRVPGGDSTDGIVKLNPPIVCKNYSG